MHGVSSAGPRNCGTGCVGSTRNGYVSLPMESAVPYATVQVTVGHRTVAFPGWKRTRSALTMELP